MKIISKWKDYYDHLSGVYGEDPKIILDRRKGELVKLYPPADKHLIVKVYIAGVKYEGYYSDEKYYWGDDLKTIGTFVEATKQQERTYKKNHIYTGWYSDVSKCDRVVIPIPHLNYVYHHPVVLEPIMDPSVNIRYGAPIVVIFSYVARTDQEIYVLRNPRLSDIGFQKMLPAKDIYLALSAYLAPKDPVSSPMSDKQKAEAKGFDSKRSFRPKMK